MNHTLRNTQNNISDENDSHVFGKIGSVLSKQMYHNSDVMLL